MFPNQFDYHRPESVQAAASLLAADPDAKLLAGGHSLLPAMKLRLASPSSLVDLGGIAGLVGIDASGKITIGAMTTYAMLRDSRELSRVLPMVTEAADNVGDPAVQARGTLGGALAHSDPAADFTAIFLALNGTVEVTGAQGSRTIVGRRAVRRFVHDGVGAGRDHHLGLVPGSGRGHWHGVREISSPGFGLRGGRCGGRRGHRLRWNSRLGADRRHRGDEQSDTCREC